MPEIGRTIDAISVRIRQGHVWIASSKIDRRGRRKRPV